MITVIIPIVLLLAILLCKKIPLIGGNIHVALAAAGFSALILGGVYNPIVWAQAWFKGLDTVAWVMALTVFGSIYAQTQIKLGTMDVVFRCLKSQFGRKPRALACCIILTLVVSGAILGGGSPSIAIVSVLMIPSLVQLGFDPTQICAVLVMGGAVGSLMPPVSQAITLSSSLAGVEVDAANAYAYFTVGSAVIMTCLYVGFTFVKKGTVVGDRDENGNLLPPEKVGNILHTGWTALVPFILLVIIILLRTLKIVDLVPNLINLIKINGEGILVVLKRIPIVQALSNATVDILIFVTIIAYFFPKVHKEKLTCIKDGLHDALKPSIIQVFSGLMVGAFVYGGQLEVIKEFAATLDINVLKIGGALAMVLLGMLTGTQSTPNNAIFSFFGPALIEAGVTPGKAAAAGAQFAAAGQGMPPADLTTFFAAGLVSGVLKKDVDPVKSMCLAAPVWLWITITGFILLYI
jgi:MFS family permease